MKLERYLTEAVSVEDIFKILEKDCLPFIKEARGGLIWRGSSKGSAQPIERFIPREDRNPMNTPMEIHNALNREFKKRFGWEARNGVFTFGDRAKIQFYGRQNVFFPIGDFKYVWASTVTDLYGYFEPYKYAFDEALAKREYKEFSRVYPIDNVKYVYGNKTLYGIDNWRQYIRANDIFSAGPSKWDDKREQFYVHMDKAEPTSGEDRVYYVIGKTRFEWMEELKQKAFGIVKRCVWGEYQDYDLPAAIKKSLYEVSFQCKAYYLVSALIADELEAKLYKYR
jgi:hypothetical protein